MAAAATRPRIGPLVAAAPIAGTIEADGYTPPVPDGIGMPVP